MRETVLIIMIILFIIGYFKVGYALCNKNDEKILKSKILYIALMLVLFGFSMVINFILINQQGYYEKEIKELKKGLPQYEEIRGVYRIKNK